MSAILELQKQNSGGVHRFTAIPKRCSLKIKKSNSVIPGDDKPCFIVCFFKDPVGHCGCTGENIGLTLYDCKIILCVSPFSNSAMKLNDTFL